jgi:hypothetical protein
MNTRFSVEPTHRTVAEWTAEEMSRDESDIGKIGELANELIDALGNSI